MDDRRLVLHEALSKYGDVFQKDMGRISKDLFYYKARLRNYTELWQQPDKLEARALGMLYY